MPRQDDTLRKPPKRARLEAGGGTSPFTYEILAQKISASERRVSTTVTLSIPSPGDECPLTLDPIGQSKLDFIDCPFVSDRPLHSKRRAATAFTRSRSSTAGARAA